jgi:hypothetical protein
MRTIPEITLALSNTMDVLNTYMENNPIKHHQDQTAKSIKKLRMEYQNIIFKPADKNLGLVALRLTDYNEMILTHLLDTNQYISINFNSATTKNLMFLPDFTSIKGRYTQLKNRFLKSLTLKSENVQAVNWFKSWEDKPWKIPLFYVLPKIHKKDNTSRPILAATHWITNPISIIVSSLLKQRLTSSMIVKNSEGTVKKLINFNERIFLNEYENSPNPNFQNDYVTNPNHNDIFLVTLDIINLYPSIKLDLLYSLFNESTDKLLLDMLKFIFSSNYLSYNNTTYKQKDGIAMGTNCSGEVANYYLLRLIDPVFEAKREISFPSRYLDDIMFIWIGKRKDLVIFIDYLQNLVPGIKFTSKIGAKIDFLDITIALQDDGDLYWHTHQKELNMYTYISPKSCHPNPNLKGWIRAELTRYRRLSSSNQLYQTTKQLFFFRLKKRGYSSTFLNLIFENHSYVATATPINNLKVIPFKCKYSFRNNITHLPIVTYNYLKNIQIPTHRITFCWLGSPSILRLLTSADLTTAQKQLLAHNAHRGAQ